MSLNKGFLSRSHNMDAWAGAFYTFPLGQLDRIFSPKGGGHRGLKGLFAFLIFILLEVLALIINVVILIPV